MILNGLIIICIAIFLGLVLLGHVVLLGDLWRYRTTASKLQDQGAVDALRIPAE
jgi:hypothetical protein